MPPQVDLTEGAAEAHNPVDMHVHVKIRSVHLSALRGV
jgi:hypothetical protein